MNWDSIQESWKQIRGRVTAQWGPSGNDVRGMTKGRREQLCGRTCQRYGISKEEANRHIDGWIKEPGALDDWNDTRSILDM